MAASAARSHAHASATIPWSDGLAGRQPSSRRARPQSSASACGSSAAARRSTGSRRPATGSTAAGSPPRKSWTGTLKGFADGAVEVDVDGVLHRIPHDQIAKAHLEYDFEADLRRKD